MIHFILILIACFVCVFAFYKKNKSKELKPSFLDYEKQVAIGILLVGILVRFILFWKFPLGLNQDEASIGYDAFADLFFGMDRNGYHNPVYSVAWGSGHSGLYIALIKPFIYLFGLNNFSVRIVNVLFGCAGLFAFYGSLKKLCGKSVALVGLFLLAINPWHIMMSRWGLECNLFPNIFLIGLYFLVKAEEKPVFYPLSLFIFGLSLYSYGTSYMFIPVFLLFSAFYLVKYKKISIKMLILSSLVFVLTAIPIFIFMVINVFDLEPVQFGFISFPKLVDGRYNTTITVLGGNVFASILENLKQFFKILFVGNDNLIWNSIPFFGVLYHFSWPFIILGAVSLYLKKENKGRFILYTMVPAILILATLSRLNINRANVTFLLFIYLCAEGIHFVMCHTKKLFYAVILGYFITFSIFCGTYFTSYQKQVGNAFFEGYGEAIQYAVEKTDDTIYLSEYANGPYVFALFYEKTDPAVFISTVDYKNPNSSVRHVNSFGRFVTGAPEELHKNEMFIASIIESEQFDDEIYEKVKFGGYYVIYER